MNLLWMIPYTPTPIRTRSYNLLRGLLKLGHHVTLATLWENENEIRALEDWKAMGVQVLAVELSRPRKIMNLMAALPRPVPFQARFCWEPRLMHLLKEHYARQDDSQPVPDAVHIEHLRGAAYGLELQRWWHEQAGAHPGWKTSPIVWDSVDCISLLFEKTARTTRSRFGRLAATVDLPRTRRYEGWLAHQFNHTLVTAEADRAALEKLALEYRGAEPDRPVGSFAPLTVLPNGVDLGAFAPNTGPRDPETIVMTGKMSYHANVTAALYLVERIMPWVWQDYPNARVQIVGANPPGEIRALTAQYPGKIEVTGWVADVAPYLQKAALAAAPIAYGVGIQNKVLEAMACAAPVVCTPQAASALKTRPGQDLLVGDTPQDIATAILQLLKDPALGRSIGACGRQYVEANHSWDAVVRQLENIYSDHKTM